MSLIGDALDRLLAPIIDKVKSAFAPFGRAFNLVGQFWDKLTTIGSRTREIFDLVESEISEWRNFKENVAFRTKLISLPAAIDHAQDFIEQVREAWAAVLDIVKSVKGKFETTGNPTEEAEEAISDIENSGFKTLVEKFPKLFKGLEKVLGFLAILLDAFESISNGLDDVLTILRALQTFREDLETGGPLFLKQSNPRKIVHLDDGTRVSFRVGNLHQ